MIMYLTKRNKVKYKIVVSKFPRKVKPITGLSINPDFSFFDAFFVLSVGTKVPSGPFRPL